MNYPYRLEDLESIQICTESHDGSRHYITEDGKPYPSVTTIVGLKSREHIKLWRERVGEETANRISTGAARRGTKVHNLIETYLRGEEDVVLENPLERSMFNAIQPVLDEILPIVLEAPLISHNLQTAGRVDCIGVFDEQLCIIDFKTSSKYKEYEHAQNYFLQMTAYAEALEEMTGEKVEALTAMVVLESGHFQLFECEPKIYLKEFTQLRERYRKLYGR